MKISLFCSVLTILLLGSAYGQTTEYDLEYNENALFLKAEHEAYPKQAKSWKSCLKFAKKTTKKAQHLYIDQVNKQADGIMDYRALSSTGSVYNRFLIEELILGYVKRYQMVNWAELMFTYNYRMDRIPFSKVDAKYDPNKN